MEQIKPGKGDAAGLTVSARDKDFITGFLERRYAGGQATYDWIIRWPVPGSCDTVLAGVDALASAIKASWAGESKSPVCCRVLVE